MTSVSYPLIEFPVTCYFCDCEEFVPVSTGAGQLIPVCPTDLEKFQQFYCERCNRYHPNSRLSDGLVACEEFRQLLESAEDYVVPEWFKDGPADHWHDNEPCWHKDCEPDHWHGPDFPCYDAQTCRPCPACGGPMDPGENLGRGCSRQCAYGSYYDRD